MIVFTKEKYGMLITVNVLRYDLTFNYHRRSHLCQQKCILLTFQSIGKDIASILALSKMDLPVRNISHSQDPVVQNKKSFAEALLNPKEPKLERRRLSMFRSSLYQTLLWPRVALL